MDGSAGRRGMSAAQEPDPEHDQHRQAAGQGRGRAHHRPMTLTRARRPTRKRNAQRRRSDSRPLGGTAPSDKIRGMAEVHRQWQQLFTAALKEHSVVGIRAIGMWHLGRPPTRSEMTAARYAGSRHGVRRPLPAATVSLLTPAGRRNVLIMARPDLSLSDWPKRPRCSPPVTTLRTPLKLVFRKWPCRQTPTATVRGDRSHPRGGSSCRQGGGIRES